MFQNLNQLIPIENNNCSIIIELISRLDYKSLYPYHKQNDSESHLWKNIL